MYFYIIVIVIFSVNKVLNNKHGTHSLLGGQGREVSENRPNFPLRQGIEPGITRL